MTLVDPSHPLSKLLQEDRRYKLDAYLFILEALSYAHDQMGMGEEPPTEDLEPGLGEQSSKPIAKSGRIRKKRVERHLSGQQLSEAARNYALEQYGYMARTVLGSWGIKKTADFGEIVFNMIEIGQMRKTRKDKREDFHDAYDFAQAFTNDYRITFPANSTTTKNG